MGGSTLPLAPDVFSGRKLGKYEVLCRLSTGGMAEIFLASQRGLAGFRKLVVLKQILPDIAGEEEFVQMFLDEARVTAAFNHPHIAQVFDLDVADGELFLAMEFVPGATLVEVAKGCRAVNEPIPVGFSLEAVRDTALALHYAHTFTDPLGRPSPVVHRDVAEKNIMVTYEGVTKLLDFGIAKNLARKSRTQVGMVKGTSGYMSPEQILGEPLDSRSDLFSLGVVLHECLTGLRLFHAKTPEAGVGAILQGQVPAPSRANKTIPPELDAIVLKALARRREDRYSTTLEFARALERAVGPLIWHPEQSAELISRLFSERREQTRQLLVAGRALSGESTGEVNVAHILSPPAALSPEPATDGVLPQITAPLPSSTRPPSSGPLPPSGRTPTPIAPHAQEVSQSKPPTPPRGAPSRRMSSAGSPAAPSEPSAAHRPVFEPIPQKRTSSLSTRALPPSPPPAPPEPPPAAREDEDDSQPAMRTALERLPRGDAPRRSSRVNLHTMGTLPHAEGVAGLAPPAEAEEPEEHTPAVRPSGTRSRQALPSERVPSSPGRLSQGGRRRAPARPPPEADDSDAELQTSPVRVAPLHEPGEDTNETFLPENEEPENEEGPTLLSASVITLPHRRKSGGLLVALAVAVLLLGTLGAMVALGLDGGRLSGLLGLNTPPPSSTVDLSRPEPIKPPEKRPQPAAPATAQAPETKVAAAPPPTAPAPSAPSPAPEPSTPAPPSGLAPSDTQTPADVAPENALADPDSDLIAPAEEPSPPEKKAPPSAKRSRRDKASASGNADNGSGDDEPAVASGSGVLTLVTTPYAKVYLGKRYLGDTPLFKVSIPSGKHSLKLVSGAGRTLRVPVDIKAGETTALKLALDQLDPG